MEEEACGHDTAVDNVCVDCGLCMGGDVLVSTHVPRHAAPCRPIEFRYAVRPQQPRLSSAARGILAAFELECYTAQIVALLGRVKFTVRLSQEDRVAVLLYHLCMRDGFPMVLADILRYTKASRFRLLKARRDAFSYCRPSRHYLRAVFDREVRGAANCGVETSMTFERFAELADLHVAANVSDLCMAAILRFSTCEGGLLKSTDLDSEKRARIRRLSRRLECC